MMREWRNLKMLKRAGRSHDPAGVDATKEVVMYRAWLGLKPGLVYYIWL